jgi:hypothetical protein
LERYTFARYLQYAPAFQAIPFAYGMAFSREPVGDLGLCGAACLANP